jgi:TPR repeat protein
VQLGGLYLGQNELKALEINEEKGLALLAKAATEQNSATAYYMVGKYLFAKEKENGIPENTPEEDTSIRFFKQAAALGDADAMYVLGVAYHEGVFPGSLRLRQVPQRSILCVLRKRRTCLPFIILL